MLKTTIKGGFEGEEIYIQSHVFWLKLKVILFDSSVYLSFWLSEPVKACSKLLMLNRGILFFHLAALGAVSIDKGFK